jgi:hypothetical protein
MDVITTLENLKTPTIDFDIDLSNMHRGFKKTFSRAVLQWLLEARAEVLIITYMMTSSSSAYGSSFHDNGDGDNNKIPPPPPPSKRKSTHDDDDDDDGNDNGKSKDDQGASMTPKDRCKGWCGHTSSWHHELVGPELQSVLQANHPQHAGGLQREQRFHSTGCPGPVEGAYQSTPGALCTACRCMRAHFECLDGTEKLITCNSYYSTVSPDRQAGTGVPPRNPGLRPNFQVQQHLCPACGLALPQVLESWSAWGRWRARNPGNNGPNGFGSNGNWNNQQDPDNSGNEGEGDYQGIGAGHYNSHSSCNTTGAFSILKPSRRLSIPPPRKTPSPHANHAIPPPRRTTVTATATTRVQRQQPQRRS